MHRKVTPAEKLYSKAFDGRCHMLLYFLLLNENYLHSLLMRQIPPTATAVSGGAAVAQTTGLDFTWCDFSIH